MVNLANLTHHVTTNYPQKVNCHLWHTSVTFKCMKVICSMSWSQSEWCQRFASNGVILVFQQFLTWTGEKQPFVISLTWGAALMTYQSRSMNTWTVKWRRLPSHLFPPVSSSGFKRLCPPVVNCGSKPTQYPSCLLRRAWLCLNCLCWCESL